jgi:hypothetical protein
MIPVQLIVELLPQYDSANYGKFSWEFENRRFSVVFGLSIAGNALV